MPIIAQHPDLVEMLAAQHDVPFAVLEELLKGEHRFDRAAADGMSSSQDMQDDRILASTVAEPTLRLVSLVAENICSANRISDENATLSDVRPESTPSQLSPPGLLRLLLLGTDDIGVRSVGFPPSRLTRQEYVLGATGIWPGLLRRDPASEVATARIEAEFDVEGARLSIGRTWRSEGTAWVEQLHVHDDGRCLVGAVAQEKLADSFPPHMVPLFVFECSDVWALMLSRARRTEALDRLYPSAFLKALAISVRGEESAIDRRNGISRLMRNLESEKVEVRRRRSRARHMRDVMSQEIRALTERLSDRERTRNCLRDLCGMQDRRKVQYQASERLRISIPEPLPSDPPGAVGSGYGDRRRPDEWDGPSGPFAERLANLDAEIGDLRSRIEAARSCGEDWTASAVDCGWRLRAYVAEEALAAASARKEAGESDRLVGCLEELTLRLRQRSRDAVRAALRSRAASLDPPTGCSCKLELDDEDGLQVEFGPRPSDGPGPFMAERAAFLLLRAMQDASGRSMPIVALLDPSRLHERNRAWLELEYVPSLPPEAIIHTPAVQ
ncbi:hypothetical protein [Methylobacterium brachiatum]|uniref:hypothetical protein n=1 Tax=Methylobacterium brachiatum TaxID=269660 RepID=UPI0024490D14|nr:hypothetical protein [Methylobacterium brachiatum]MDH2312334.1 hypothetical protein [Methylobacterium brachiatum]